MKKADFKKLLSVFIVSILIILTILPAVSCKTDGGSKQPAEESGGSLSCRITTEFGNATKDFVRFTTAAG
jgi:hypothetical protein